MLDAALANLPLDLRHTLLSLLESLNNRGELGIPARLSTELARTSGVERKVIDLLMAMNVQRGSAPHHRNYLY